MQQSDPEIAEDCIDCPGGRGDAGQASVLLLLMFSSVIIGMLAFAVDLTSIWFHRQAVQAAADAACLAGASDMLAISLGVTPPGSGFTPGKQGDCASSSAAALCKYAKFNGYDGAGLSTTAQSNSVSWTFPSSVAGVTTPTGAAAPLYPFLQVSVIENVQTFFMAVLGTKYQEVSASASCGEAGVLSAPPLVVLDPISSQALYTSGSPTITIVGGPSRSIQVNSTSTTAVYAGGSTGVDTTKAGPDGTGGDVAATGQEPTFPSTYQLGTGNWLYGTLPVPDPFAAVPAPTPLLTPVAPAPATVVYSYDGCPDSGGCQEYKPGYYAAGIDVKNFTAIFQPGIYVLDNDLTMESGGVVRNAYVTNKTGTKAVLTSDGVMFYMHKGAVKVLASAGKNVTDTVSPTLVSCDGSIPTGLPTTQINGSILNAQCTDNGTYAGSGGPGTEPTSGGVRGLLFFFAHTNTSSPGYDGQGGGAMLLSGTEYFHSTTTPGLMQFKGNPSGTTYLLGYIVTDDLSMSGNAAIAMVLTSKKLFTTLKVALLN